MPGGEASTTNRSEGSLSAAARVLGEVLSLKRPRGVVVFLALLFVAGALVRLWGLSKFHYWDEMVYLQNAQVICCGKTNYSELDFRPPLLSLIFAGVFLLWHHIYAACIVAACLNALGPVFLFLAGRLAVGRWPAAIASVLLAFSPFFVGIFPEGFDSDDTGNSLLTDSPALTLVLLALWLLLRALGRPAARRFLGAGVALALCVLMRFGSIPSVGMLLLLPLAARSRWKALLACVGGLAAGMAPYLLWCRWAFGDWLFTLRSGWTHVEGPIEPSTYFLTNAATIFTPLALAGLVLRLGAQPGRMRGSAARLPEALTGTLPAPLERLVKGYLWLWLLAGLVFFSWMPHKEPRYILPLAPPVLLLAGAGLSLFAALPQRGLRRAGAALLAVLLLVAFLPLRARLSEPFFNAATPDEEPASRFLEASVPPTTSLYMSFNYPAFAFYSRFHIHELSSWGAALYRDMNEVPAGEVLIVYREAESPAQSDVAWVEANPRFKRLKEYPTLVIFRSVGQPAAGASSSP